MKIAIVADPHVPIPPIKYGGTEKVIYYLIKGLKQEGHEPILFGPGDSTVDCEVVPTVDKSFFFPRDKSKLPEFRKKIKEVSRNTTRLLNERLSDVDVIHSHSPAYGFDMKPFADFPHVITLHGPIIFKELPYYMERSDLNYVAISRNQREAFPELNYVKVVYNGEDPEEYPVVTEPKDYVCFLGRFDREKNPHLAIQLAINYGIKIKLGGKIDFLGNDYFNEEVKPLLKHPLVEHLGELDRRQSINLIKNARVNLHPTGFREPFGLTILEAAYCGTPTLAIARGSMPELIQEGKTGMLVEDFVEGFHQIEQCMDMDREYIAKRARKTFNYHNMTKGYAMAYRKVIRHHRKKHKND